MQRIRGIPALCSPGTAAAGASREASRAGSITKSSRSSASSSSSDGSSLPSWSQRGSWGPRALLNSLLYPLANLAATAAITRWAQSFSSCSSVSSSSRSLSWRPRSNKGDAKMAGKRRLRQFGQKRQSRQRKKERKREGTANKRTEKAAQAKEKRLEEIRKAVAVALRDRKHQAAANSIQRSLWRSPALLSHRARGNAKFFTKNRRRTAAACAIQAVWRPYHEKKRRAQFAAVVTRVHEQIMRPRRYQMYEEMQAAYEKQRDLELARKAIADAIRARVEHAAREKMMAIRTEVMNRAKAVDQAVHAAWIAENDLLCKRALAMQELKIKRIYAMVSARTVRMRTLMLGAEAAKAARAKTVARALAAEETYRKHLVYQRAVATMATAFLEKIEIKHHRKLFGNEPVAEGAAEKSAEDDGTKVKRKLASVSDRFIEMHMRTLMDYAPAVIRARARYAEAKLEKEMVGLEARLKEVQEAGWKKVVEQRRQAREIAVVLASQPQGAARDSTEEQKNNTILSAERRSEGRVAVVVEPDSNSAADNISTAEIEEKANTSKQPEMAESDREPGQRMDSNGCREVVMIHETGAIDEKTKLEKLSAAPSVTPPMTPPLTPLPSAREGASTGGFFALAADENAKEGINGQGTSSPRLEIAASLTTTVQQDAPPLPAWSAYTYNAVGSMFVPPLSKKDVITIVSDAMLRPETSFARREVERTVAGIRTGRMDAPAFSWLVQGLRRASVSKDLEKRQVDFMGPSSGQQQYSSGFGIDDLMKKVSARNRAGTRFVVCFSSRLDTCAHIFTGILIAPPTSIAVKPTPPNAEATPPVTEATPRTSDAVTPGVAEPTVTTSSTTKSRKDGRRKRGQKGSTVTKVIAVPRAPAPRPPSPQAVIYVDESESGDGGGGGGVIGQDGTNTISVAEWVRVYGKCDDGPLLCAWIF